MSENDTAKIENKELVDAIRNYIIDDSDDNRNNMLQSVINAHFIAPITFTDNSDVVYDGTNSDQSGKQFSLNVLTNEKIGKTMFPVFTDKDELNKAPNQDSISYVITNVKSYFDIFSNKELSGEIDGIVINPFGMSMMLDKEFFLHAAGPKGSGMTARKFDNDTKFAFAIPNTQPTGMLNALTEYLKFRTDVTKSYFLLMGVNDEEPKPLIVVDYKGTDPASLFDGIVKIATPFLDGAELGMSTYENEMIVNATKDVTPFYIR